MPIKKRGRLNDTVAIVATPAFNSISMPSYHESRSVSVRKIDNGYITSESTCKGGDYKSTERFSSDAPDIGTGT
jgi:hypothetical protein